MRTYLWSSLTAFALAIPATAERTPTQESTAVATETQTAQERCDALAKEAKAAERAWIRTYQDAAKAAEEAGEDAPAFSWDKSPMHEYIPKFQALAEEGAGTEDAVPYLLWIVSNASWMNEEAAKGAVETLCASHHKSPHLKPLASMLPELKNMVGAGRSTELLTKLEAESTVPAVRGWATFAMLGDALEANDVDSEAYKAAKQRLLAAAEAASDKRLSSTVESKIRIRETFGNGMVAPDITGIDLDGEPFKLSDYKGQVVFLDFWGDW